MNKYATKKVRQSVIEFCERQYRLAQIHLDEFEKFHQVQYYLDVLKTYQMFMKIQSRGATIGEMYLIAYSLNTISPGSYRAAADIKDFIIEEAHNIGIKLR